MMTKDQIHAGNRILKCEAEALRNLGSRADYILARRRLLRFQAEHEATLRQGQRVKT